MNKSLILINFQDILNDINLTMGCPLKVVNL
jgi:hypothetical protein